MTNPLFSFSTGGQSGGGSRTTTIQFLEAGVALSGRTVRVIDADPANGGYTEATADPNSVKLIGLMKTGQVNTYINKAAVEGACLLIDCGAGLPSMAGEVVDAMRDVFDALRCEGYQHTSIFPVNSNKALVESILVRSIARHRNFGNVVVGTTDLAGSNNFPDWLASAGLPIIQIPLVAAGYIDLRMRSRMPLSAWLVEPDPNTCTAKAAIATATRVLFGAPAFAPLLTSDGRARLLSIESHSVTDLSMSPTRAAEATDDVLRLRAARIKEYRRVLAAMRLDPASPLQAYFAFDEPIREALAKSALLYPAFVSPPNPDAAS